jgi:hypothetical protein
VADLLRDEYRPTGEAMSDRSGAEHERLRVLVGRWKTEGRTLPRPGSPSIPVEAIDTYEWLPGSRGLFHVVDAWMGEEHVEGAEIIGWDPEPGSYVTAYFGTDGPGSYRASFVDEDDSLVWRMWSGSERFTGRFNPDRTAIVGRWELKDETDWVPWMDITLTKKE